MSESNNISEKRKKQLKELILKLHQGESPDLVRRQLMESLRSIPYNEVVEVEQELIEEGLPESEILELCDIHGAVLEGNVDLSGARAVPEGHPVDVFYHENIELKKVAAQARALLNTLQHITDDAFRPYVYELLARKKALPAHPR